MKIKLHHPSIIAGACLAVALVSAFTPYRENVPFAFAIVGVVFVFALLLWFFDQTPTQPELDPIYAIEWAVEHEEDHFNRLAFLENWQRGNFEEWSDFVEWAQKKAAADLAMDGHI